MPRMHTRCTHALRTGRLQAGMPPHFHSQLTGSNNIMQRFLLQLQLLSGDEASGKKASRKHEPRHSKSVHEDVHSNTTLKSTPLQQRKPPEHS